MGLYSDKNKLIYTAAGPINVCTLWEFLQNINHHKLHPNIAKEFAIMQKNEFNNFKLNLEFNTGIISQSIHSLKQNPMTILTELKRTTRLIECRSGNIKFIDLLKGIIHKAMDRGGIPTHLFAIGKSRFALVRKDDIALYIDSDYNQSLVCNYKDRNFTIYAPNVKLEF